MLRYLIEARQSAGGNFCANAGCHSKLITKLITK
jgi:hypothetical protein